MSEIKKLTSEIVHQNPWWTYYHDTFEKPDGTVGNYYYGDEIGPVIVVPRLENNSLLLTRQYRYLGERLSVEFPRGGRNPEENDEATGRRELLEETGYVAERLVLVGACENMIGLFKSPAAIMLATGLTKVAAEQDEPTGTINGLVCTVTEFENMIQRGEIWDGQTLAAWALCRHYFIN